MPQEDTSIHAKLKVLVEEYHASTSIPAGYEEVYRYTGNLSEETLQLVVASVEEELQSVGVKKGNIKKSFTVLLEGLQNANIHSKSLDGEKVMALSVSRKGDVIDILLMSLTDDGRFTRVKELVTPLNAMDRVALKQHYLQVMDNGHISAKGGAGLGLITMVLKSSSGLSVDRHPYSGDCCIMVNQLTVGGQ